jgi:DcuC family C4-dicarboxylate transporter
MNEFAITLIGSGIVIVAVAAIVRGVDVRLALLSAGVALCAVAGDLSPIFKAFLATLADEKYIVPICTALGFAHVLRLSECDRHLVMLLLRPVQSVRWLLIPGSVAAGFLVNIAVISQAGTAIAVATVLIPLLRSVGIRSTVIGATLVLGASIGGELLNPGAPELRSVVKRLSTVETPVDASMMQPVLAPLLAVQLGVATLVFWWMAGREPRDQPTTQRIVGERINLIKASVPLLPLALLLTGGAPLYWYHVPEHWIADPAHPEAYDTRLIGASMIVGCVAAVLAAPRIWREAIKTFFEGVGYAMANIISIIVAANCFGTGITALNLAEWVAALTKIRPGMIWPVAGTLSFLFAVVSGSGMAATESLYRFFAQGDWPLEGNLAVGAVTSIAAAAGRTTSPAAAVLLVCAPLVGAKPMDILRRIFLPLVIATVSTVGVATFWYR